ncbi:glycosyltransferase [Mycobacterium simiae]|uniref:Glycosyltransferase n=2 Tax=Mycobacterium simiae TaxID=1784 RepID=A0A5B1BPU5_MYCSI|nr:glycosyltransferase [Mycobacterium simiae]
MKTTSPGKCHSGLLPASEIRVTGASHQPSVTIVIPAYNEARLIGRCLESCIAQTTAPDEIIVVNNKSTDDTPALVRQYQRYNPQLTIRLLEQNEHQGLIPTRNHGFDHARSDVIGRIDADTVVPNYWVEALRRRFTDPAVDAATGPVLYYDMPLRMLGFRGDHRIRSYLQRNATDQRFLLGANMAIRNSAWRAVRQLTRLDPEDQLHEDIDLALTLFKNNFEIAYEPTMAAGISGRRLESSARDFYRYITRYTRTTKAHGVKSWTARLTLVILLLVYLTFRPVRFFYDVENNRFTLSKLRAKLSRSGRQDALTAGHRAVPHVAGTLGSGRRALLIPPSRPTYLGDLA